MLREGKEMESFEMLKIREDRQKSERFLRKKREGQ